MLLCSVSAGVRHVSWRRDLAPLPQARMVRLPEIWAMGPWDPERALVPAERASTAPANNGVRDNGIQLEARKQEVFFISHRAASAALSCFTVPAVAPLTFKRMQVSVCAWTCPDRVLRR